jgi:pSer/pThr/pTyr-binding forkhead associated (FHA) protein
MEQAIYVQDCGSTHGTYLAKQKMETGVEYTVNDGDIITFGQRVTSGAGKQLVARAIGGTRRD